VTDEMTLRTDADLGAEQAFLQRRIDDIEAALGTVAAVGGGATPLSQPLDALDRSREIASDMLRQVRVRGLEDAIAAQLDWLDRAEERLSRQDGEPKVAFNRIALDRRLLSDLRIAWQSERN
jgi:hypothetical protein